MHNTDAAEEGKAVPEKAASALVRRVKGLKLEGLGVAKRGTTVCLVCEIGTAELRPTRFNGRARKVRMSYVFDKDSVPDPIQRAMKDCGAEAITEDTRRGVRFCRENGTYIDFEVTLDLKPQPPEELRHCRSYFDYRDPVVLEELCGHGS